MRLPVCMIEVMVSFDATSLFNSIPQDLAIETIELLLQNKYDVTADRLGHAQVLQLLNFCLRTYFIFDGTIHEQVKGTPIFSPISGFNAEALLQRLESLSLQLDRLPSLAAWNVSSTLDSRKNSQPERRAAPAVREVMRFKLDIPPLSLTRFSEQSQLEDVGDSQKFLWSDCTSVERSDTGVALFLLTTSCSNYFVYRRKFMITSGA
nr:unnamed protein product [Spirometra erinaceieuropaei]